MRFVAKESWCSWCLIGGCVMLGGGDAWGQFGVSPSQTGQFLREMQARQTGEAVKDPLGAERTALEAGRALSRPSHLNGSRAEAGRLAADVTSYSGQYQAGRMQLNPWFDGWQAPKHTIKSATGDQWGTELVTGLEFNRFDQAPGSDGNGIIQTNRLLFDGSFGVGTAGQLTVQAGLGLDHAFTDDFALGNLDANRTALTVLPGSTVAYDFKLGGVHLTFYDRFGLRPTSVFQTRVNAFTPNDMWQNDAGIAASWELAPHWTATLNYTWTVADSWSNGAKVLASRNSHSVTGRVTFAKVETWQAGIEGGDTWSAYEQMFNNDGEFWHAGLFAEVTLRPTTKLRVAAGWQNLDFDHGPLIATFFLLPPFNTVFLTTGDDSDISTPYYSITLTDKLTERVSQELALGYESALNTVSNAVQSHYVNYGLTAEAWKGGRVTWSGYFESSEMSGGVFAQDTRQYGTDFQVMQQLGRRLQVGLSYHYGCVDPVRSAPVVLAIAGSAGIPAYADADYVQQGVGVHADFLLKPGCMMRVAWQHLDGDTHLLNRVPDLAQDRVQWSLRFTF